jgi:hypothetical protein
MMNNSLWIRKKLTGVILLNTLQRYEVDMGQMNRMEPGGNIRALFIEFF